VKDVERWEYELNKPLRPTPGQPVTAEQLEEDGQAFMAFAQAVGVSPPRVTDGPADPDVASPSID
jgi:hypothetical protein